MKNIRFCPICKSVLVKTKEDIHLRLSCGKCDWVYYFNPLPSVAAFVHDDDDKILLIKRGIAPGRGKWALPTGFVEQNELPEQAVIRELEEEANIKGTVQNLIGVYTEKTKYYGSIILIGYEIRSIGGKPKPGTDAVEANFFPSSKLPAIAFTSHCSVIQDGLKARNNTVFFQILKSKITEARVTHTQLFYRGSMGIDSKIMKTANLLPGEKVQVLNYNNGVRLETYVIEEKAGSGKFVLYGPASKKGKIGDKLCILSYALVDKNHAKNVNAKVIILDKRNRIKRRHI